MLIQHNLDAMRGLRYGQKLNNSMSKTLQKLSSGYRINSAADDAAGLAVSEKMRLFMTEYDRCTDNVKEGQNLAQTADAALQEVNDMLCRAKELCVRAANGTYSKIERDALQDELDALYTEMDRIFEGARFNTVHLFRHGAAPEVPGHYELIEHAEPTDALQEWGDMDNIQDRFFDRARPAKGASVTIQLDSKVDPGDAQSLIGKSFGVMDSTCLFEFAASGSSSTNSYTGHDVYRIGLDGCNTVQDAFNKAVNYMKNNSLGYWGHSVSGKPLYIESAKVNGNQVTLTFEPIEMVQTITLGNSSEDYIVQEGNGEISNDRLIYSKDQFDLAEVDGSGNDNNSVNLTAGQKTVTFMEGRDNSSLLTAEEKAIIARNHLFFYGGSFPRTYEIHFEPGSGSASNTIYLDSINTVGQLRSAIASAINNLDAYNAQFNGDGSVTITQASGSNRDYFYEAARSETIGGSGSGGGGSTSTTYTTTALDFSLVQKTQASGESRDTYEMTIPATLPDYFSLKIGDVTHTFYNGIPAGHSSLTSSSTSTSTFTNIQGKSVAEVCDIIKDRIAAKFPDANVSLSDNTISISNKYLGSDLNVDGQVTKTSTSISFKQSGSGSGSGGGTTIPAKNILFDSNADHYFEQTGITVDIDLSVAMDGGAFDASKLVGRGFQYADVWYEFDDGDPATQKKYEDSNLVDVSACASYDDVKAQLEAVILSKKPNWVKNFTITSAGANSPNFKLTCDRSTSSDSLTFQDGYKGIDGVFTTGPEDDPNVTEEVSATFATSGGKNIGKPTATIDFSSYNSTNFSELYGKGFRVTCATCAGEYINVMFCNDKTQLNVPPSFEIMDDSQTPPVPRIIHNLAVELKGMKSGEDIVKAIVRQLTPELDHYTEVTIGEPASVLHVMDKRMGDIEIAGKAYRAQVLSGVYTNFIYTHKEEFIPDPTDGIPMDFRKVEIYAGSEPTKQIIDIHLPYLTLENLRLTNPASDLSTTEAAAETMGRVDNANNAISYARGTIGADFNRLEHAHASLSQAEVQMTDAYSRIRDADMAEEMTEKVRVSILQQAQQTVFMHSMQQPQQIISLLGA